jgi:hypothetical protein
MTETKCPTCGHIINSAPMAQRPEPAIVSVVNTPELQELVSIWTEGNMPALSMGDKVEIAIQFSVHPNLKEIFYRWFAYNVCFADLSPTRRHEMYLYQNKLSSLFLHIDKFDSELVYGATLDEHRKRVQNFREKNLNYGFSQDPVEDRKMAIEKERLDICMSVQDGLPYAKGIMFAENIAYYNLKQKSVALKKKSPRRVKRAQ